MNDFLIGLCLFLFPLVIIGLPVAAFGLPERRRQKQQAEATLAYNDKILGERITALDDQLEFIGKELGRLDRGLKEALELAAKAEQTDDEKFHQQAQLSNTINRVASMAGRKAAEDRVLPQVDKIAENWLVKNLPSIEAVFRANIESRFKLTKRSKPVKVKIDTSNLGPNFQDLTAYFVPSNGKSSEKPSQDGDNDSSRGPSGK